jgi:hypothetical protein
VRQSVNPVSEHLLLERIKSTQNAIGNASLPSRLTKRGDARSLSNANDDLRVSALSVSTSATLLHRETDKRF